MATVRRLGPGDERVLAMLATEDADFDLAERGAARTPLSSGDAATYLADPAVLHWVAEADGAVVGHLLCLVERRRSAPARQVVLYEIGVRRTWRRRGVGRALMAALDGWLAAHGVAKVWVLADNPGAEAFYAACGFARDATQPVQMSRSLTTRACLTC